MAHQAHLQMLADLAAWIMQKRLARMSSYSLHMILDVKGLIDILQRLLHTWLLPFPSFTGQQCKVRGAAKGVGGAGVWNEMAANRAGLAVLPQFRLRHCKYCCKL
eukprot:1161668-Pelagomonas_calceolata.AAC.6